MPSIDNFKKAFDFSKWEMPKIVPFDTIASKENLNNSINDSKITAKNISIAATIAAAATAAYYGIRYWFKTDYSEQNAEETKEELKAKLIASQIFANRLGMQNEDEQGQLTNELALTGSQLTASQNFTERLRTQHENEQDQLKAELARTGSQLAALKTFSDRLGMQNEDEQSQITRKTEKFNTSIINPFQNQHPDFPALYNQDTDTEDKRLSQYLTFNKEIQSQKSEENLMLADEIKSTIRMQITPNSNVANNPFPKYQGKVIILKVVHGTWSKTDSFGGDEEKPLTKELIIFAKQLALASNAMVIFDAFQWDGKLSELSRKNAGDILAKEIAQEKTRYSNATIWTIGHSHGCNVINNAAQTLKKSSIGIDNAIFLASPKLDIDPLENYDQRYNIKYLLNIWGLYDCVGTAGSVFSDISLYASATSALRKEHSLHQNELVRNIILKRGGQNLNHVSIQLSAIQNLAGIIEYIGNNFSLFTNLIMNIYNDAQYEDFSIESAAKADISDSDSEYEEIDTTVNVISPEWKIEAVIAKEDPLLTAAHLQSIASPTMENIIEKSIRLSEKNEEHFEGKYAHSIFDKPDYKECITSEFGHRYPAAIELAIKTGSGAGKITVATGALATTISNWWNPNKPFNINEYITEVKKSIKKEPNFKQKTMLLAHAYQEVFEKNGDDIESTRKKLDIDFENENSALNDWQYKYEWIIGRTRTSMNSNWSKSKYSELLDAKTIFNKIKDQKEKEEGINSEVLLELLYGYEKLSNNTQQALLSSLEQGLKIKNIEEIALQYLVEVDKSKRSPIQNSGAGAGLGTAGGEFKMNS